MKIAILSDIHSNKYAFESALSQIEKQVVEHYVFLGDYFGYYPWAQETFNLLKPVLHKSTCIIGNHDNLLIQENAPNPQPEYWDVIMQNKKQLMPEAIAWLGSLRSHKKLNIDDWSVTLCHGTPDDPLNGRFYPDNEQEYNWFPTRHEIVLMGHTHYKLHRKTVNGGIILNPGSVGQPRGNQALSSYAIMDTVSQTFEFYEFRYDVQQVIRELEQLNWYPRAIDSLKRTLRTS